MTETVADILNAVPLAQTLFVEKSLSILETNTIWETVILIAKKLMVGYTHTPQVVERIAGEGKT